MMRLRDSFSDSLKDMRHRRVLINIHITILAWITEFSGFFVTVLGSFILGHGNTTITLSLQIITVFIYFVLLPCIFLINDSDLKADIAENYYYISVLRLFRCDKNPPAEVANVGENQNEEVQAHNKNETPDTG